MEFILLTSFLGENFISKTFGYIDPGSGSMIIQMVIGALVGVGVAIKVYWDKLKYKFSSLKKE
jgi:hypothetical protein